VPLAFASELPGAGTLLHVISSARMVRVPDTTSTFPSGANLPVDGQNRSHPHDVTSPARGRCSLAAGEHAGRRETQEIPAESTATTIYSGRNSDIMQLLPSCA